MFELIFAFIGVVMTVIVTIIEIAVDNIIMFEGGVLGIFVGSFVKSRYAPSQAWMYIAAGIVVCILYIVIAIRFYNIIKWPMTAFWAWFFWYFFSNNFSEKAGYIAAAVSVPLTLMLRRYAYRDGTDKDPPISKLKQRLSQKKSSTKDSVSNSDADSFTAAAVAAGDIKLGNDGMPEWVNPEKYKLLTPEDIASMNKPQEPDTSFFDGCRDRKSLDERYEKLCQIYHPDIEEGDREIMDRINAAYKYLKNRKY